MQLRLRQVTLANGYQAVYEYSIDSEREAQQFATKKFVRFAGVAWPQCQCRHSKFKVQPQALLQHKRCNARAAFPHAACCIGHSLERTRRWAYLQLPRKAAAGAQGPTTSSACWKCQTILPLDRYEAQWHHAMLVAAAVRPLLWQASCLKQAAGLSSHPG